MRWNSPLCELVCMFATFTIDELKAHGRLIVATVEHDKGGHAIRPFDSDCLRGCALATAVCDSICQVVDAPRISLLGAVRLFENCTISAPELLDLDTSRSSRHEPRKVPEEKVLRVLVYSSEVGISNERSVTRITQVIWATIRV